jgi:threonine/homoserine/homoserine lactone efflux protein
VDALLLGLAIGSAAGVSPGPLLALVLTETLRSGTRAGITAALAPLLTDAVVIAGTLLVLRHLPRGVLPVLGVLGGAYDVFSALQTWREAGVDVRPAAGGTRTALRRAAVVNLPSPHPWVTWATVLGPLTLTTWRTSHAGGALLVAGSYLTLLGAKVVLAALVGRGRRRLVGAGCTWALRVAALLLAAAGIALAVEFLPLLF